MKGFRLSVSLIITALLLVNCAGGGGPVTPGDYLPPVWDTTTGVTSVVPGENQVTVIWGTATDAMTPPVEYLLYIDEDDNPWDQSPVLKATNDPHVFSNLDNGTEYWCGVRSRDSADPPNVEKNDVVISATPEGQITLDTTPPVWDDTVGVVTVVQGEGSVTVEWGSATDAESPPVEYLLYIDEDDEPWDQEPLVFTTNDPYTFTDLFSNIDYHFGVRCRDSADIPNSDSNENFLVTETIPRGWTLDWGHGYFLNEEVQIDSTGNFYIMGETIGLVDFNPGEGYSNHNGTTLADVYILKLNANREFQWVKIFQHGGLNYGAQSFGFYIDSNDYIYLGYSLKLEKHLGKIDGEGNIIWDLVINSADDIIGIDDIFLDENDFLYLTGSFADSIDFDPGEETDIRTSNGFTDAYVSKFDLSGSYQWVRTWGGESSEGSHKIITDQNGNFYNTGTFRETVDFDPGPGTDYHTSNGSSDIYLSSFDSDWSLRWALTWGGLGSDGIPWSYQNPDVAISNSGVIYVSSSFEETVDFDPGEGEDIRTAFQGSSRFLSRFDSNGIYNYVYIWDSVPIMQIGFDEMDNLYTSGSFSVDVDLDPTDGESIFIHEEGNDSFLSKYDPEGNYLWSIAWGGKDGVVYSWDIALGNQGNVYVLGDAGVGIDCDFDPGPGVEIHGPEYYTTSIFMYLSKFPPDGYW